MPDKMKADTTSLSAADMLAAAEAMPGVADLMALYQQHAKVVATVNAYIPRPRPQVVLSSETGVIGLRI